MFPEYEPGNTHCRQAFKVEQQGRRRGGRKRQPNHQQDRADHATGKHNGRQPGNIRKAQWRFGKCRADKITTDPKRTEAQPGAEIEQTGQHPGIERAEQQFGKRRARAEQQG
jgi:hypothetical protein